MKAVRIHDFGGIEEMKYEEAPKPNAGMGEVLVRVKAAGVGPWDALIRTGQSKLGQELPITLGSDLSGIVEAIGPDVSEFQIGDEIFGSTNHQFSGAYAEYAVADACMIARKPSRLSDVEAASVPVVACTAWQMVFDHGHVDSTKRVLVQGAAGSVGAYAVQLAKKTGAHVIATAFTKDIEYVRSLGADQVIDVAASRFEEGLNDIDVVIDTVGGDTQARSFSVLKPGGILVSSVSLPEQEKAEQSHVQVVFFYVDVNTKCLMDIAGLLQSGELTPTIGEILPLTEARTAHEMLAGKPHNRGKIVLTILDGI